MPTCDLIKASKLSLKPKVAPFAINLSWLGSALFILYGSATPPQPPYSSDSFNLLSSRLSVIKGWTVADVSTFDVFILLILGLVSPKSL